ncbi:hypothetical protein BTVI_87186 [Pitangus sulphuratus]|nr:hypothetical protein BTVI_87186 [Pitangus sulphuratus]
MAQEREDGWGSLSLGTDLLPHSQPGQAHPGVLASASPEGMQLVRGGTWAWSWSWKKEVMSWTGELSFRQMERQVMIAHGTVNALPASSEFTILMVASKVIFVEN